MRCEAFRVYTCCVFLQAAPFPKVHEPSTQSPFGLPTLGIANTNALSLDSALKLWQNRTNS